MIDERVSANFHLSEFIDSGAAERLGLDNTPNAMAYATLRNVLIPAVQQIRDLLAVPLIIKSGYRSPAVNTAVRGASNSQHLTGNAADFIAPAYGTPMVICQRLVQEIAALKFDQLIFEGSWVHVSFSARRRNEVLTAHFSPAGVTYTAGLA